MANFLGISTYYHDSAAALVRDGEIVAAAQEERFSRRKHDSRFPSHAIAYCLGEAFIEPSELDAVVFHDDPLLHLDRFFVNAIEVAPRGRASFVAGCHAQLGDKARLAADVEECLGDVPSLLACGHHRAHAASAFYPSRFEEAAILTMDGVGEWASCTVGRGEGNAIEVLQEVRYPHSLGLLYSAFTQFCGFKVNSGEYKLMGLAPYGVPRYADVIRRELVDIREDGSIRLETSAFGFLDAQRMIGPKFEALFGGPARSANARITRREMDLAASVQRVTEDVVLALARHSIRIAGSRNLVVAGGVALNCVANGRVWRELDLEGLFIQPAADDSGGALGAALYAAHALSGDPRPGRLRTDAMNGARLGPAFSDAEIEVTLSRLQARSHDVPDDAQRARLIAQAIARGQVVGFFSGRMEFGPRALGGRSILADPRREDMQRRVNLKIKNRESFRPFAPVVLADHASSYFELDVESPYMLLVAPVRPERTRPMATPPGATEDLLTIVDQPRSDVPAITHVDYTARVQTVDALRASALHHVLEAFHAETGCPVLVNTSFNVRGEPIVCTPDDAYRCFMMTDIDILVLETKVLYKSEQPPYPERASVDEDPETESPTQAEIAGLEHTAAVAEALFDEVIVPLAEARRQRGREAAFPHGPDAGRETYFELPKPYSMLPGLRYPGDGTPDGLLTALEHYWEEHEGPELSAIVPRLRRFAQEHERAEHRTDGKVDIFVYTMF